MAAWKPQVSNPSIMEWLRLFAVSFLFVVVVLFDILLVPAARNAGFERVTFVVRGEPITPDEGLSFGVAAREKPNPWPAALMALTCLAGAVTIRFVRRPPSATPGCAGWFLLLLAALALLFLWSLYHPSCPPGMWC